MLPYVKMKKTRQKEIIRVAEKLFMTNGFENTTVSQIAQESGVVKGAFYYYFKSKDEILNYILEKMLVEMEDKVNVIINDENLNIKEKIEKLVKDIINYGGFDKSVVEYMHKENDNKLHKMLLEKSAELIVPPMSALIQEGIEQKIFDTKNPELVAKIITQFVGRTSEYLKYVEQGDVLYCNFTQAIGNFLQGILSLKDEKFIL